MGVPSRGALRRRHHLVRSPFWRWTDNDLAHVDVGRLPDRKRDGSRNCLGWHAGPCALASSRARTDALVIATAKLVRVIPCEMTVTRRVSPASWRRPSEMTRTAALVPAYTAMLGTTECAAVEAMLTKCPKP